jgi:hypothetical protein
MDEATSNQLKFIFEQYFFNKKLFETGLYDNSFAQVSKGVRGIDIELMNISDLAFEKAREGENFEMWKEMSFLFRKTAHKMFRLGGSTTIDNRFLRLVVEE